MKKIYTKPCFNIDFFESNSVISFSANTPDTLFTKGVRINKVDANKFFNS